jgi:hypothetical protein
LIAAETAAEQLPDSDASFCALRTFVVGNFNYRILTPRKMDSEFRIQSSEVEPNHGVENG